MALTFVVEMVNILPLLVIQHYGVFKGNPSIVQICLLSEHAPGVIFRGTEHTVQMDSFLELLWFVFLDLQPND